MTTQPSRTLVLGGARSGKSRYAEGRFAREEPVTYVATAPDRPGDDDWAQRVRVHRERRPASWTTRENPILADLLGAATTPVLVDCVSLWLTDVLDRYGCWTAPTAGSAPMTNAAAECELLVASFAATQARTVIVSSEVGWGVVPSTASGRLFRDELGRLNAALAAAADEVVLVVAGLPMRLK